MLLSGGGLAGLRVRLGCLDLGSGELPARSPVLRRIGQAGRRRRQRDDRGRLPPHLLIRHDAAALVRRARAVFVHGARGRAHG
eukprot:15324551-Alexandrium_andersonii.AAC.1